MSSFLSWMKPTAQKDKDEITKQLNERSQKMAATAYNARRDGPGDVVLALRIGELLRDDRVKEWCSKDGPDAAEFAKTYLDLMHDAWDSPVTGLVKIAAGLSGAIGPLANMSQNIHSSSAVAGDIAAASKQRVSVDPLEVDKAPSKMPLDHLHGLRTETTQVPEKMNTLSNRELVSDLAKSLWEAARMVKFSVSPKVLKFLWHIRRQDADLTVRELEEVRMEMNEALLSTIKEDEFDSATRIKIDHLNETFNKMAERVRESQHGQGAITSPNTTGNMDIDSDQYTSTIPLGFYKKLPRRSNIRLLEVIHANASEPIHARLHIVDINEEPSYMALSYVWLDPRISLYQRSFVKSQAIHHELICDGQPISITENLYNALRALFTPDDKGQSTASRLGCNRMWVDQLCINQRDEVEKCSQVAFMGQIYESAKSVISWLGPEDRHTGKAYEVVKKLSSIPRQVYTSSSYDPTSELKRFQSMSWIGFLVLLSLPYFQRAWIVQELAFSKHNTMIWGSQIFVWKDIKRATRYLSLTNAWGLLRMEVEAFKPIWEYLELESLKVNPQQPLSSAIDLHIMVEELAFTALPADSPYKLLMAGRLLQANNHRDKFYAMLGLAKMSAQRLAIPFPDLKPDYSKTIEQVIKEFTCKLIQAKGDLTILTQVEDRSFRKKRKLPSWMPDYTTPLLPRDLLGFSQENSWKADGGARCGFKLISGNAVLVVHGHREDMVQATAVSFNNIMTNGDWRSVLALTKSLHDMDEPHIEHSPDDRLLSALLCSSSVLSMGEDSEELARLKAEFADWMINNLRAIGKGSRWDPTDAILLATRELDYRMKNLNNSQSTPNLFTSDQLRRMMFSMPQTDTDSARDTINLVDSTKEALAQLWKLDPEGFFPSPSQIRETLRLLDSTAAVTSRADVDRRERERQEVQGRVKRFELAVNSHLEARVLFRSASGYLGLAPQSAEAGRDEIWVLAGLPVPIILRPTYGSAGENSYQVVGHCYLPNRMTANTENHPPDYFQPIRLV